jgi:hypothetical protein
MVFPFFVIKIVVTTDVWKLAQVSAPAGGSSQDPLIDIGTRLAENLLIGRVARWSVSK